MEKKILFYASMKRHRGSLLGIGILLFLTALSLSAVAAFFFGGTGYIEREMERTGFGDLTAWVADVPDLEALEESVRMQEGIEKVTVQRLIFAEYEANGIESDSEGQLIPWTPEEETYRFLQDNLRGYEEAPEQIRDHEVYVSPSMVSILNLMPGDTITFPIARNGRAIELTVAGFYEDPVMGSTMIGMKGFLVSEETYQELLSVIEETGMDALARDGAMLHMEIEAGRTVTEISRSLNESTPLSLYSEFMHSAKTIHNFMLILQNAFCGLLAAFAVVLFGVTIVVLGHSISGIIEQEWKDLGILKTVGMTGKQLARQHLLTILTAMGAGAALGILLSFPVSNAINRMTVTTTGFLIPIRFLPVPCVGIMAALLLIPGLFSMFRLRRIHTLKPVEAIRGETGGNIRTNPEITALHAKGLPFYLALRQVCSGTGRYVSACLVAAFLVFFGSLAGRMNGWLGADGKGMMDAFNPADLDFGVQVLGRLPVEETEAVIRSYTEVTDVYLLAMPSVFVNGTSYTANVITEPERFHISQGKTCMAEDEVVLTESLAADLDADIGDRVVIRGDAGSREFTVSGIYHCANDMGANLGMNREGYLSIGQDDDRLWCYHYFLKDPEQKQAIMEDLEARYGGDVHVHENSWPGLKGIIAAMHLLLVFLYGISAIFVGIVTVMAGTKILGAEQRNLGIYRSIGCSVRMLRGSFALRFGIVAAPGGAAGTLAAAFLTDPLVAAVMRLAGISNFASGNSLGTLIFPGLTISALFLVTAYLAAAKIGKSDMNELTMG